jgi:hypothetical protein
MKCCSKVNSYKHGDCETLIQWPPAEGPITLTPIARFVVLEVCEIWK